MRRVSGWGILIWLGLFRVGGALESCKDAQTVSLRMPDRRSSRVSEPRATETPKEAMQPSLAGSTHPRWLERRQTSRRVATPTRGCPAQSRSTAGHQTQTSGLSWIFDGLEGPLPVRRWRLASGVAGPLAGRPTDWLSATQRALPQAFCVMLGRATDLNGMQSSVCSFGASWPGEHLGCRLSFRKFACSVNMDTRGTLPQIQFMTRNSGTVCPSQM